MNSNDNNLSTRVDALLKRISNILFLNASFLDNLGLLKGKMGVAIFFYHYYRYSGNVIYNEFANELIDEIYTEINVETPISFADGLAGIGWGLHYLVKNKFVKADIDEVLSEIDNAINLLSNNGGVLNSDQDHFFSLGHYYIARLANQKTKKEKNIAIIKKNRLIFYLREYERILSQKQFPNFLTSKKAIDQINSLIWFSLEAQKFEICPTKIQEMIKVLVSHIVTTQIDFRKVSELELFFELLKRKNSFSDIIMYKKLKKSLQKHKKAIKDKAEYLIKDTVQKIIYEDYFRTMKLNFPLAELIYQLSDDGFWTELVQDFKKDRLSLLGIGGLGLGLIHIISTDNKVHPNNF